MSIYGTTTYVLASAFFAGALVGRWLQVRRENYLHRWAELHYPADTPRQIEHERDWLLEVVETQEIEIKALREQIQQQLDGAWAIEGTSIKGGVNKRPRTEKPTAHPPSQGKKRDQ